MQTAHLEGYQRLDGLGIQPPGVSTSEAGEEFLEVIGEPGEWPQGGEDALYQGTPPLLLQHEDPCGRRPRKSHWRGGGKAAAKSSFQICDRYLFAMVTGEASVDFTDGAVDRE